MIVCICRRVSDRDIERAVRAGAVSFEDVQLETGAATCCGRCSDCARSVIERAGSDGTRVQTAAHVTWVAAPA